MRLTDYRSYAALDLILDGRPVVLFGANGAGKTNLLEAISFFSPGRGIRRAKPADIARRILPPTAGNIDHPIDVMPAWGVVADIGPRGADPARIAVGQAPGAPNRRVVRIDGTPTPTARLSDHLSLMWLTPAQDRLFTGPASDRRKFLDRFSLIHSPAHGRNVLRYEKARSERNRLFTDGISDDGWFDALETDLARCGAEIAIARAQTVSALIAEIEQRPEGAFPKADIALEGDAEDMAQSGAAPGDIEAYILGQLRTHRGRDRLAGRTIEGVHRSDFLVQHRAKSMPAAECSTGEQKALLTGLFMAHARAQSALMPILLLDEMAAHLDVTRRAALIEELLDLGTQVWMTGTDQSLFEAFDGRAQMIEIKDGGAHEAKI